MKTVTAQAKIHRSLMNRLLYGSALAGMTALATANAYAQDAAAPADIETVVVTGTSIRGAAPVGANVITIDRDTIEASGATTVQSLLTSVPAVTGFGNAGQGGYGSADGSGTAAPTIHSLGASASNSTLILVDNHRIPLSGLAHTLADPSTIPQIALQRVEVLPDGASSVYGSDAVAGVLNFITRKNFQGAETEIEYGAGLDYGSVTFSQIIGSTWDKGSVMAAYSFVQRDKLLASDRSFVNDNQTFRGLSNLGNFNCGPATIAATSTGNIYSYPYTGGSVANATTNATCGQTRYTSLLPSENRHAALVSLRENFTDWFSLSADLNWSNRVDDANISRGVVTSTVFGPGSGKGTQINPFYVAVPGSATGTETVRYDFNTLFGPGAHTKSGTQVLFGTVDANFQLGGDWVASLETMAGNSASFSRSLGTVCTACAYLALNGTTNANGSLTTSSNPAVLGTTTITTRPLTTANALNVWGALGSTAAGGANTSQAVMNQLLDNANLSETWQTTNDINLKANGSLFALPAGDVKTAVGAEYRYYTLTQYAVSNGAGGASITNSSIFQASFNRSVYAVYAEFLVPLVSPEMNIPLIHKLDFDVSARYDRYSDVGDTRNPRLAFTWEPTDGLKFRGSYGTSFVAPALTSTGGAAGLTTESNVSYGQGTGGPATVGAGYTNNGGGNSTGVVGGAGFCAAGCTIGNATNQGITVAGPGGITVKPEKATSYSAGFDLNAGTFLPSVQGLDITATYWYVRYIGAVTSPVMTLDTQISALNKNLIINPSDAQIAAAYNSGSRVSSVPSGPVTFIQYYVQQNAFNLYADGVDFGIHYSFDTGNWGDFRIGWDGSLKTRFDQQGGGFGGAIVSNLNKNANTTFSSLALTHRTSLAWHMDPVAVSLFVNYTNPYYQPTTTAPFTGYYHVPADTTVDLNVAYDLPSANPYLAGTQIYVNAENLFNAAPPPYNTAVGYDTSDASPLGRLVSFGIRKKW